MKTILVPLDGSALAEQVLPYVRLLAPLLGARVQLLRVFSDIDRDDMIAESLLALAGMGESLATQQQREQYRWETLREQAQNYLLAHATRLEADGLDVSVDVRSGPASEVIVECAERTQVALIAMATHGYSGLKRWALGSVTDKVVHASTTPVLVVRAMDGIAASSPAIKRILVPLDGSDLARQALPLATELAMCANAEVMLLTAVVPPISGAPSGIPAYNDALMALSDPLLEELGTLAGELQQQQVPIRPVAASGLPAETIVDQAVRRHADLIVLASHGYSGLRRWVLGSVTDKVMRAATTPVVVVRAQARAL